MADTSEYFLRWIQIPGSPGTRADPVALSSPGILYYFGPTQELVFVPAPATLPTPFDQHDRAVCEQVFAAIRTNPQARTYSRDQVYAISSAMTALLTIGGHGNWGKDNDAGFSAGTARQEKLDAALAAPPEPDKK